MLKLKPLSLAGLLLACSSAMAAVPSTCPFTFTLDSTVWGPSSGSYWAAQVYDNNYTPISGAVISSTQSGNYKVSGTVSNCNDKTFLIIKTQQLGPASASALFANNKLKAPDPNAFIYYTQCFKTFTNFNPLDLGIMGDAAHSSNANFNYNNAPSCG